MANNEVEKTQPNIQCPIDPKVYALLVDEEMARRELITNIAAIQDCKVPQELFVEAVEQVLIAVQEYMKGVKELGDLIKLGK